MIAELNGGLKIDLFYREGALAIQTGFPCGNWNDQSRGILQLRPFNITNLGQIDLGSTKFVETDRNVDAYRLQNRDVIFNNTNSEELVGKAAIWTNGGSAVLSNHMTVLRVLREDRLSPEFLSFYLLKRWFDGYFHAICRRHVNQASVSVERLRNTDFPEFDVAEQRKIAAVLGLIQLAIEQQERLIALTTELKKALLHKLFTEGLRGEPQKQSEIGPVPESWEIKKLGSLVNLKTGKLNSNAATQNGDYPFFTCSQETFRIDHYAFDTEAILLSGNNAQGIYSVKHYNGKFNAYQRTYVITVKAEHSMPYPFLHQALSRNLERLRSLSIGTSTKYLTLGVLQICRSPILSIMRPCSSVSNCRWLILKSNSSRERKTF